MRELPNVRDYRGRFGGVLRRLARSIEQSRALGEHPLVPDEARAHAVPGAGRRLDATTSLGVAAGRVLVVDRDPEALRQIEVLGRRQLFEVAPFSAPDQALASARRSPPDLAILGAQAGVADELVALAHRLRQLPGCAALPIAFVSDEATVEDRVVVAHAGASLHLPKPLDPMTFDSAMHQLLALARAERPRILICDDDEEFAKSVAGVLIGEGMVTSLLSDPARILDALAAFRPDLLLLDVVMPAFSGLDLCRMLRATPAWQDLPILFLTGVSNLESRLAAFEAGGDDYLAKPVVGAEILARIKVRVERARLLRDHSDRDALTGLFLRRAFFERLGGLLSDARRRERAVTVCLLDLDHFKKVNDRHGHLVGDQVLVAVGKHLQSRFRAEDLRGRWGGEEFILAFGAEGAGTIAGVMRKVLDEVRAERFEGSSGETFGVTFSAGIASAPQDGADVEALLRIADKRLYRAKAEGRARVVWR